MSEQFKGTFGRDGHTFNLSHPLRYAEGNVNPGDMDIFAPSGTGFYGLQEADVNPFALAPRDEAAGGVIFFDNTITKEQFDNLCQVLEIDMYNRNKEYIAFVQESNEPQKDGYLRQLRIVSGFALKYLFGGLPERESLPEQELTEAEAIWEFMEHEREAWGTSFGNPNIAGKFGGDGYFAKEQLQFGLTVESGYFSVFRVWSRGWRVTK